MYPEIAVTGIVKKFEGKGGWYYLEVPAEALPPIQITGSWGFSKIEITLGTSTWQSSLMPMGTGRRFIALKSSIRNKEKINENAYVTLSFHLLEG